MKRYEFNLEPLDTDESPDGSFVLYEEAHAVEVDRDIKAANLQLLVEKVLEVYDLSSVAVFKIDDLAATAAASAASTQLLDIARSLKQ